MWICSSSHIILQTTLSFVVVPTNLGSTIKFRIQLFNRNKNLPNN
ncbi:hypothetical protein LEP1GSC064_1532 [Leptospira kirschneri serovar Grippotyphosa str. Moskva]|nr:hypothetical protein LEP1GSC044_3618 [Leptospira kirschneri serovar Grippotyphosa str. RM52]EKQ85211.1 hypothetical protein LEP1GSC064_1532 [Leptospira kirschneri serovar Grippotyphosa str. Moskva]EKR06633.1 hypothetical protein LEP1GSC122_1049 [Leptospira kirschneri serovar Valbuzzi str. 200702274]EMK03200.1 hypothetical protein LEP1GSC176_3472 [Leptospira kirschneri str. MMD1493]EMN25245.1 hypothetical protein LEP1GSC065_2195 [Leptospira kirschneri serovar Sokoine str. RM1]